MTELRDVPASAPACTTLRWRPFRLPLRRRFEAASGALEERRGVLVELVAADGARGVGEASPLPALDGGTAADVARLLAAHGVALLAQGAGAPDWLPAESPGALALRCALDVALLDLDARRRGVPVAALLSEAPAASVLVNAVIGAGAPAEVVAHAREAVAAGYSVLKLKAGTGSLDDDLAAIAAVRDALPAMVIRVDANGAWDEPTALAALARLAPLRVELLEQPVAAEQIELLARLRLRAPMRIAADESVSRAALAERVLELRAADLLVLKPMQLGGLRPALALARRAAARSIGSFATTTFDSSIGIAAALHLAAALPWDAAQGLGTGEHLAADVTAAPLRPQGGRLHVTGPGLGVAIDDAALDAIATGPWSEARV